MRTLAEVRSMFYVSTMCCGYRYMITSRRLGLEDVMNSSDELLQLFMHDATNQTKDSTEA